jgi:S1-C subfamily serine protease
MNPDERLHFEQLRKTSPEIDQLVVEHTFFLQQLNRFDETKKFRNALDDIHIDLAEKGLIQSTRLKGKARVVYLYNKYKRTAAIAASIAGFTALTMSALVWSLSPSKKIRDDYQLLSRDIKGKLADLDRKDRELAQKIDIVADNTQTAVPEITYKSGGTGFMADAAGLIITNAHVVQKAKYIAVQNSNGKDFRAEIVHLDLVRDLAILRIADKNFKAPAVLPYSFRKSSAELAESVFTLGFPREELVYGEGYLSAKTGREGDTLSYQIAIAANPGNSGGPILNKNGEVIGMLSAKQTTAEGVVFATQSKYILSALNRLPKDSAFGNIKTPATSSLKGLDRMQQVKKMAEFVYMVKIN